MPLKIPDVLEPPMLEKFFEAMENPKHFVACILGFFCGMRIGEVTGLRVDNVNLDNMTLKVVQGKFSKDRIIPIPEQLKELLECHLELVKGSIYMFSTRRHDKEHVGSRELSRYFNSILQKVGYDFVASTQTNGRPRYKYRFHSLRHSYATYLLNNNVDIRDIQALLGHSSIQATEVYTHVSYERKKDVVERVFKKNKLVVKKPEVIEQHEFENKEMHMMFKMMVGMFKTGDASLINQN